VSARLFAHRSLVLLASLVTATALAVLPGGTATAAPSPAEIERQLDDLGVKLDKINEQYNDAYETLKQSRAKQATLGAQIKAYQVKTDAYEQKVNQIGAAAYKGGRPGMMSVVLNGGSPDTLLEQLSILDVVTRDQSGTIEGLLAAKRPLDDAKRKLDAEVAKQAAQELKIRKTKDALNKDLAKWRALKAQATPRASRSSGGTPPVYDGPAEGRGRTVVEFAFAQLGKPYVFGADGPDSYDCSGLTLAAWRVVGVSMPHSARQQYAAFPKVSRANLQPGDIVFFYDPIHHNGIYIGNNTAIHAPQEGENVEKISLDAMPYSGAVRPS
jgi:cell wall-associated NlpC family hydrolase